MQKQNPGTFQFILLFAVILISRIPFLGTGYGVEEDSWGMINALRRIHETGVYEVSRFPGHTVQEFIYYILYGNSYFLFNFITALISTAGFLFFAAAVKELGFKKYFWSTLALAFIPVVFIKSTDTMDFMWALSFMMMSFYFVLKSRGVREIKQSLKYIVAAGITLGLAIGARFTAALLLLPLLLLFFDLTKKDTYLRAITLSFSTILTAFICFIPVIRSYNPATYFAPLMPAYPDILKTIYKATIGVFGAAGLIVIIIITFRVIIRRKRPYGINKKYFLPATPKLSLSKFLMFCYSAIILYALLFIWQPHKSAYLIPVLPFLVLLIEYYSSEKYSMLLAIGMVASSFLAGINLEDNFRGTTSSLLSKSFSIASQPVSFDLLQGPVLADHSRRKQKIEFVQEVISNCNQIKFPAVILAGWYINEIEVLGGKQKNPQVNYFYFLSEDQLKNYTRQGYTIFYLPQQEQVNDLRWKGNFTKKYAKPMFNDDDQKFLF